MQAQAFTRSCFTYTCYTSKHMLSSYKGFPYKPHVKPRSINASEKNPKKRNPRKITAKTIKITRKGNAHEESHGVKATSLPKAKRQLSKTPLPYFIRAVRQSGAQRPTGKGWGTRTE